MDEYAKGYSDAGAVMIVAVNDGEDLAERMIDSVDFYKRIAHMSNSPYWAGMAARMWERVLGIEVGAA